MNRIIFLVALLFTFISEPMSQVLILVDEWYKMYDDTIPPPQGQKIQRYMNDITNIEGKDVELMILYRRGPYDFEHVWELLRDKYQEYIDDPAKDTLEGVVLLGDIPVPTFHVEWGKYVSTAPCEYFYMDLWDNRVDTTYPDWEHTPSDQNPWERFSGNILDRRENHYYGDAELDIWVSRIYATNINYLRAEGAPWGTFLEEYEIIDAYLNKVHKRMDTTVSVRRGVAMGRPPGFGPLPPMAAMGNLGLNELHHLDDMVDLRLNQAAAWQAMLQSGGPGNINYGSFHGIPFTDATYERACTTSLSDGYYEWAAVFAHSSPIYDGFHQYHSGYEPGGGFFNVNNATSWIEKESGGRAGRYYEWNFIYQPHAIAQWSAVIPDEMGGTYAVYMYWDYTDSNSENSYYYMHGEKDFDKLEIAGNQVAGDLDQSVSSGDNWHFVDYFIAEEYDSIVFVMAPNCTGFDNDKNRCIADAVEFRLAYAEEWDHNGVYYPAGRFVCYRGTNYSCRQSHTSQPDWSPWSAPALWKQDEFKLIITPGNLAPAWNYDGVYYPADAFVSYGYTNYKCLQSHYSQIDWKPPIVGALWQEVTTGEIIPNDFYNINNRGANGFRLKNWYNRSFCDMQDEGGQSKVLFIEGIACCISNYLTDDNLGLLYGMGHAGLIMMGNSFYNWSDNDYDVYTEALGPTGGEKSFGEAYLDYANRDFIDDDVRDNFIMFGAGTLKSSSY